MIFTGHSQRMLVNRVTPPFRKSAKFTVGICSCMIVPILPSHPYARQRGLTAVWFFYKPLEFVHKVNTCGPLNSASFSDCGATRKSGCWGHSQPPPRPLQCSSINKCPPSAKLLTSAGTNDGATNRNITIRPYLFLAANATAFAPSKFWQRQLTVTPA